MPNITPEVRVSTPTWRLNTARPDSSPANETSLDPLEKGAETLCRPASCGWEGLLYLGAAGTNYCVGSSQAVMYPEELIILRGPSTRGLRGRDSLLAPRPCETEFRSTAHLAHDGGRALGEHAGVSYARSAADARTTIRPVQACPHPSRSREILKRVLGCCWRACAGGPDSSC